MDYDEGYSMIDIDNNWLNSNMEYDETDSDSDSEIDDYNYNSNTNNWSILTRDKINRQTNNLNDSFLDRINKKLESLEAIERSVTLERKNDSFLDLYERLRALNSPLKNEREFEPHHRSSSTKTMTDNWHINNNRKDETGLQTLKATDIRVDRKIDPVKDRITRIKEKIENFIKERSNIDSVRDTINEDKERDKIKKGMVKETLEKFERPNSKDKEVIRRKLDIKDEIDKVNNSNDSLKEMMKKHNNDTEVSSSIQIICDKLEIDLQKEKEFFLKQDIERQKSLIKTKEEVGKVKEEIEQEMTNTKAQDKAK